jgi:putative membrane protein insertion efficiency factor
VSSGGGDGQGRCVHGAPGIAARACIAAVRGYQATLSRIIGGHCRFEPSCSCYSLDAFRMHGAVRGAWLTLRRLARCHPWGGQGHDPVPPR